MITIKKSNILIISNCDTKTLGVAKKALTIKNPAYARVVRITGNAWAAQRLFKYFKEDKKSGDLILPRAFCGRFTAYLDKNEIEYEVESNLNEPKADFNDWMPIPMENEYKHQNKIVADTIKAELGVVYAGTGAGKTIVSCEVSRRLGLKTLIICPTTVIASQFKLEYKKWFKYDVGIIDKDHKDINNDVIVATWQSLASKDCYWAKRISSQVGLLIIDECHGIASKVRIKTLECFNPKHIYGLSGSPNRSKDDGKTDVIFFYLGPIISKYEETMIKPTVEVIYTRVKIPVSANYHEMIDTMVANDSRNTLIQGIAVGEAVAGKKVIILTKRREHCEILKEKLKDFNVYYADSDDKNRNDILNSMRAGKYKFNILLGTFSLLSTGLDIPELDRLIIAGDLKSDVLTVQIAGRILRFFAGKTDAKIYDLCDNENPILKRQYFERKRLYDVKGWEIIF